MRCSVPVIFSLGTPIPVVTNESNICGKSYVFNTHHHNSCVYILYPLLLPLVDAAFFHSFKPLEPTLTCLSIIVRMDHQHSKNRQCSMDRRSSIDRQNSMDTHSSQPHQYYELPPLSTRSIKPLGALPYPIPMLRPYRDFNHSIHKYQIHIPRHKVIERLKPAAASNAQERGYYPDTGLVGGLDIDEPVYYTLIFVENLVGRVSPGVHTSTFGVLGQERHGQWKVRSWIQLSGQVGREIQKMVKETILSLGWVVKNGDREAYGGRRLDAHMGIWEHEAIWNCIQEWDSEMRRMWRSRFEYE
jgi:hypothetical protein